MRAFDELIFYYFNVAKIHFGEHDAQLGFGGHSVAFFFDEAPKVGEWADGGIKRAISFFGHGEGALDDSGKFGAEIATVIGAGEGAVGAMDAEEFVDCAKFIEGGRDRSLHFGWLTVNGNGNKGAEVRLDACDRGNGFSGRPALAAGEQTPEQGAAPAAKCGTRAGRLR